MAAVCSFCKESVIWAEVLSNKQILCQACKVCTFFETHLTLTGDYAGQPFKLLKWHRDALKKIYGTLDDDGCRQYRDVYIEVPTGNSKTTFCAGLVLYSLSQCETAGTEVYSAATAKDQAAITFRYAQQQVNESAFLRKIIKVIPSHKTMYLKDDRTSYYSAISADGDVHDGINPYLVIRDEIHRWRTRKALELNDLLERKMLKRKNPLTVDITTAGDQNESPLGWRRHEYARRINEKIFADPRFLGIIYAADTARILEDENFWTTREARIQANPSHEEHGGYIKDAALEDQCRKAQNDPQLRDEFLRFNLNFWTSGDGATKYIDIHKWDKGNVELRALIGRRCWGGLDLSTSIDLTAFVLVFPSEDVAIETPEDDLDGYCGGIMRPCGKTDESEFPELKMVKSYDVLPFFWMPKDNVKSLELKCKVPYSLWVSQGLIEATEGNEVDYSNVRRKIKWAAENFDLQEVDYDPYQATETAQKLSDDEGMTCVPVRQGYLTMSAPMKRFKELVISKRIRHNGHPVLRFCVDCLTAKSDGNDGVRPVKPERSTSEKRIDGAVGILNALSREMLDKGESVYNRRGVRIIG